MNRPRLILIFAALASLTALLTWLALPPGDANNSLQLAAPPAGLKPLHFRLGLIPDRNVYQQHQAYAALARYLESRIRIRPATSTFDTPVPLQVELVTSSNYAGILHDFAANDIDGAFLGSLVAVLAFDRSHVQVLAKSRNFAEHDTYAGTIFVLQDSPIASIPDLHAKKLAAVRTTMAGAIFPLFAFHKAGLPPDQRPQILWSGTHDDVIEEVLARRADAGAVKDLRLDAWEREHPGTTFRRIATGPRAPDNAFVVSAALPPDLRDALLAALLNMHNDPAATPVLDALQVTRFVPCNLSEYAPLYDMIDTLTPDWPQTAIDGPPPARPESLPAHPATGAN